MINKENYKALMDDFIEGRLSPELEEAFVLFLDEHPELMADSLEEETAELDQSFKASLKKESSFDANSIDEYLVAELEGDLNLEQQRELDAFIQKHPQYETDRQLFALTRIEADESVQMPNKESLKKRPVFVLQTQVWWSAAAAVLVGLLFVFFLNTANQDPIQPGTVAVVDPQENITTPAAEQATKVDNQVEAQAQKEATKSTLDAEQLTVNPIASVEAPEQNKRIIRRPNISVSGLESKSLAPRNEQPAYQVASLAVGKPHLPIPQEIEQPQLGQSVLEWAYKRLRKEVTHEEVVVPEDKIKADAVEVLSAKVAPIFSVTATPTGRNYNIAGIQIHRAGR